MKYLKETITTCYIVVITSVISAQTVSKKTAMVANVPVNTEESLVGNYILPDPLALQNGKRVLNSKIWIDERRPEILHLFEQNQFGKMPPPPKAIAYTVTEKGMAFAGKALRKQVTVYLSSDTSDYQMRLLLYTPANATKPSPLLLNIAFATNAIITNDNAVKPGMAWIAGKKELQTTSNFNKIDIEKYIEAGFGFATVYYGDIEPDFKDGVKYGIRNAFLKKGYLPTENNEWGAIAAWSWGLSRAMDYFEKDKDVDAKRIALNGASRLGKTALWAGATDQRFAIVIPSISGEGGASLSRRNYGETIKMIADTGRYFYWFTPNYATYANRVNELPMDSHMLIALIAPPHIVTNRRRGLLLRP
jgi:hypothetical protein